MRAAFATLKIDRYVERAGKNSALSAGCTESPVIVIASSISSFTNCTPQTNQTFSWSLPKTSVRSGYLVPGTVSVCSKSPHVGHVAGFVQISPLLAPALDQPPEFGSSTVPCDRRDLFARLVALLSFETNSHDTVSYMYDTHCLSREVTHNKRPIVVLVHCADMEYL